MNEANNRNLYLIQDSDRPMHVLAKNWNEALEKWKTLICEENSDQGWSPDDVEEPHGIQLVCCANEIIL